MYNSMNIKMRLQLKSLQEMEMKKKPPCQRKRKLDTTKMVDVIKHHSEGKPKIRELSLMKIT